MKASVGTPTQMNTYQGEHLLLAQLPPNLHQAYHPYRHPKSPSLNVNHIQMSSLIHWKSHPLVIDECCAWERSWEPQQALAHERVVPGQWVRQIAALTLNRGPGEDHSE